MPCYEVEAQAEQGNRLPSSRKKARYTIALAGNPNAGKTSLFNALTGLRSRTGNFPGTTVETSSGTLSLQGMKIDVIDLPGMYSFNVATPEEEVARKILLGESKEIPAPDAVVVIVDADNLERNLFLVSQLMEQESPIIVALNMIDVAERHGIKVDAEALSKQLGCPVIPMAARHGTGVEDLKTSLENILKGSSSPDIFFKQPDNPCDACASGCPFQSRFSWSEGVANNVMDAPREIKSQRTDKLDELLAHPTIGISVFMMVMMAVFYLIFSVASIPMDMIDGLFGWLGGWVASVVPQGDLRSLLVDGIIGGVGGILVFLPQICILFFFMALLEDSGYLARAAFVMDKLMRRIGLPGTAFIPLLSAHACAIPAIMATRAIRDPRDRLVTILIAPLMTCSARIPVYAMVTALLFPASPVKAALVFTGAYGLGIGAALAMAFVFKKTILPGDTKPLVLELPGYKLPNLRTTLMYTYDRAKVFVQQAGTIILVISIILWALATYPKSDTPAEVVQLQQQAEVLAGQGQASQAAELASQAAVLDSRYGLEHSFAGRLGKFIEPVVEPLGFDWQIGIGVITSFAAREVIVSTLAIVYGIGEEAVEEGEEGFYNTLRQAQRADGSVVFTTATSISLLIFYVLAMQCLPTQAVTRRETGTWKWAIFQFVYMTALAYGAAFIAFQSLKAFGVS